MKQLDEILHRTNLYYQAVALGKTPPNKTDFKQAKQAIQALIEDIIGEDEKFSLEKEKEMHEFDMDARKIEAQNILRAEQRAKLKED